MGAPGVRTAEQPPGTTPEFDAQAFYTTLLRSFRDEGW